MPRIGVYRAIGSCPARGGQHGVTTVLGRRNGSVALALRYVADSAVGPGTEVFFGRRPLSFDAPENLQVKTQRRLPQRQRTTPISAGISGIAKASSVALYDFASAK